MSHHDAIQTGSHGETAAMTPAAVPHTAGTSRYRRLEQEKRHRYRSGPKRSNPCRARRITTSSRPDTAIAETIDGGLSQDGTAARREQSAAALRGWQPHLILVQELYAPGEELVRRHFRALANATGLEPAALGLPRGSRRLRTGILTDTSAVEILDDGPAPTRDAPFWAEAAVRVRVRVRATGTVLRITSVHAPATTAAGQRAEAERLATRTAQCGQLSIAGGDWNCYTPDDALTEDELARLSPHLRPARMRWAGGRLTANYDVHGTLTMAGLTDPVPALPPDRRDLPDPPGTGSHPRARIDRFYLWPGKELLPAVRCYTSSPIPAATTK